MYRSPSGDSGISGEIPAGSRRAGRRTDMPPAKNSNRKMLCSPVRRGRAKTRILILQGVLPTAFVSERFVRLKNKYCYLRQNDSKVCEHNHRRVAKRVKKGEQNSQKGCSVRPFHSFVSENAKAKRYLRGQIQTGDGMESSEISLAREAFCSIAYTTRRSLS